MLLVVVLPGCRSYESAPVEVSSLREAFLARTPATPEVASFAASLAASRAEEHADRGAAPFDPADGVSLAEAEAIVLVFNAALREARAEAGVSQASAENAGLWPDPVLGLEFTRILESTANPNELFGSVGFTIPISGRLEIEKTRLGREHAAELARVARLEWETLAALRAAWSGWDAETRLLDEATTFRGQIDALLEVIDAMESLGEMTRVEARLFRLERVKLDARLDRLAALVEASRLEILRLLGLPPSAGVTLVGGGWSDRPRELEALDDGAVASSPTVAVALAEHEVAEKALEQAIREQIPDLGVVPGYGTQDGLEQFTLGLALPLPIFNGNRQAIETALAAREATRAAAARAIEALLADLARARLEHRSLARQRRIVEEDLVPLVDLQYAEARELARLGEVNTLILLDGLVAQHEAKVQLIESRRDEVLAAVEIEALLGPAAPLPAPGAVMQEPTASPPTAASASDPPSPSSPSSPSGGATTDPSSNPAPESVP